MDFSCRNCGAPGTPYYCPSCSFLSWEADEELYGFGDDETEFDTSDPDVPVSLVKYTEPPF
jgi:hypothetical protein